MGLKRTAIAWWTRGGACPIRSVGITENHRHADVFFFPFFFSLYPTSLPLCGSYFKAEALDTCTLWEYKPRRLHRANRGAIRTERQGSLDLEQRLDCDVRVMLPSLITLRICNRVFSSLSLSLSLSLGLPQRAQLVCIPLSRDGPALH